MEKLDLQVGDRITYRYKDEKDTEQPRKRIVVNMDEIFWLKNIDKEILKIEGIGENGWYTVYEKKDLLTDEEKEFLKDIIKYFDDVIQIELRSDIISFEDKRFYVVCVTDYPEKMKFENIEKHKYYTLKELGLEEEDE